MKRLYSQEPVPTCVPTLKNLVCCLHVSPFMASLLIPSINVILNGTKFKLQSSKVTSLDSYRVINWSLLVPEAVSFQSSVIYMK